VVALITIEFSDEDKATLNYERYDHPHPFAQRKIEALWLKSQGLAHKLAWIAKPLSTIGSAPTFLNKSFARRMMRG
jgi:hypothetical protein